MPPSRVGPYRIVRELGHGAFGAVFLAQRDGLSRQVALKVLLPGADEVAQARFKQEAKLASQLEHPNVVRCCDLGQDPERKLLYLALDFVSGGSLTDRIKLVGALPAEESARVLADVCAGLNYAHQGGILHRDLKPDNVLLSDEGQALLTDFGLARDLSASRLTGEGLVVGTPNYFAPETLTGQAASPRSDVYGAGLLLYECLVGRRAFNGDDFYTITNAIRSGSYDALRVAAPTAPKALARICQRALSLAPAARYESAGEMERDLREFLEAPEESAAAGTRGVAAWQLGVLFVTLFVVACLLTVVLLISLDRVDAGSPGADPVAATPGHPPASGVPASSPRSPASPRPSPSSVALVRPVATPPLAPHRRPLEEESPAALEARARGGDTLAADYLAREALSAWDTARAREWARAAGANRVSLLEEATRVKKKELATLDPLWKRFQRDMRAQDTLRRLRVHIDMHPGGRRLRGLEAELLYWVGRPRESLRAIGLASSADRRLANLRALAVQLSDLSRADTPPDADFHKSWDAYRGGLWTWSSEDKTLRGEGNGFGIYGLSGALERAERRQGTFAAEVEVFFDPKIPQRFGGLLLMSDVDNGLLTYLYHGEESIPPQYRAQAKAAAPQGATMLRVAYLVKGEWRILADDQVFPFNHEGWHRLEARYSPTSLKVRVDGREAAPIRLPTEPGGRLGVLKWYEHKLKFRNYRSSP